jgi:HEAT repeat protein
MARFVVRVSAVVGFALSVTALLGAQRQGNRPPTPEEITETARKGNAQEAWAMWAKLPAGLEKQRLGIHVAALSRQVSRGLDLYDEVTVSGLNPDRPALTALSLAAAADVADVKEPDVRALACGATLVLDATHAPCLHALKAMTEATRSADEQAFGIAALANARIPTYSERLGKLTLRNSLRVQFVQSFTRLPTADRMALLRPLLSDPDVGSQYQAVLFLSDIPGPEVTALLKNVQPNGPLRQALTIARARHGDAPSLTAVGPMLPNLDPYLQIQAGQALAEAGDPRGVQTLQGLTASGIDIHRIYAAEALARINPAAGRKVLLGLLAGASAAARPAAIFAAGRAGLGTERAVYRDLGGATPAARASAISAITDTLKPVTRPKPPAQP